MGDSVISMGLLCTVSISVLGVPRVTGQIVWSFKMCVVPKVRSDFVMVTHGFHSMLCLCWVEVVRSLLRPVGSTIATC